MSSTVRVGGFSEPRPPTTEEHAKLREIWPLALKAAASQHKLDQNLDAARVASVSSQVVNGTNLAFVVHGANGLAHRIVAHFPGSWNADTAPSIMSTEEVKQ